jgi:hypothetical protein
MEVHPDPLAPEGHPLDLEAKALLVSILPL